MFALSELVSDFGIEFGPKPGKFAILSPIASFAMCRRGRAYGSDKMSENQNSDCAECSGFLERSNSPPGMSRPTYLEALEKAFAASEAKSNQYLCSLVCGTDAGGEKAAAVRRNTACQSQLVGIATGLGKTAGAVLARPASFDLPLPLARSPDAATRETPQPLLRFWPVCSTPPPCCSAAAPTGKAPR